MKKMPLFEAVTITSLLFAAMGQKLRTPAFHTKIAGDVPSRLDAKMSSRFWHIAIWRHPKIELSQKISSIFRYPLVI